jgi:hypothetical protein
MTVTGLRLRNLSAARERQFDTALADTDTGGRVAVPEGDQEGTRCGDPAGLPSPRLPPQL